MAIAIIQLVLSFTPVTRDWHDLLKEKGVIISARSVIQFLCRSECPEKIPSASP